MAGEVPEADRQIGGSDRFLERLWVSGCFVLIRTECVREVGEFWSELFAYSEDVDFFPRARDAGWRVGVGSRARAYGRGSTASVERRTYLNTRNGLSILRIFNTYGPRMRRDDGRAVPAFVSQAGGASRSRFTIS